MTARTPSATSPARSRSSTAKRPRAYRDLGHAREEYLAAWRWRRAVEAELRRVELTFPQWLVLDATAAEIEETGDAVNQSAVARRTELDRMTVSQVMKTLSARDLVDRGPDSVGHGYRIILTRKGKQVVREATARAAAASS